VAPRDGLNYGAQFGLELLGSISMVNLGYLFRGFKTASEGPIYELHGGSPFAM